MMNFLMRICLCLGLFFSIFLLAGCETAYQRIEEAYYQDRYLDALQEMGELELKPSDQKELQDFLLNSGGYFLNSVLSQARIRVNSLQTDAGLVYISDLLQAFDVLEEKQIFFPGVSSVKATLSTLLSAKTEAFVDYHIQLAQRAFKDREYRLVVYHLDDVKTYQVLDQALVSMYEKSKDLGSRAISLQPFDIKIVAPRVLFLTPKTFFTTDSVVYDEKDAPSVDGLSIEPFFSGALAYAIRQNKTDFLAVLTDGSPLGPDLHYEVTGTLVLETFDDLKRSVEVKETKDVVQYRMKGADQVNWSDMTIDYKIYSVDYGVQINVTANLKGLVEVVPIGFSVTVTDNYRYRDEWDRDGDDELDIIYSPDYLALSTDQRGVSYRPLFERGLALVADRFSKLVLKHID